MLDRRPHPSLYAVLVALNVVLFLPLFLTTAGHVDVLPFTPKEHPHGAFAFNAVSAVEYVKALVLRRPNLDVFRVSLEFVLLLFITATWRGSHQIRRLAAFTYAAMVALLAYNHAYQRFWRAEPALWEDVRMLPSLLGYLSQAKGPLLATVAVVAIVVSLGLLGFLADRAFSAWQHTVSLAGFRVVRVLLVLCLASLAWFGVERDDPVWQLPSKVLVDNFNASLRRRARVKELQLAGADDSYRLAQRAQLKRKPRVYLLMLEAYGQRLASDAEMNEPFRILGARVDERLSAMGYTSRTAFSEAPVYGGKSWLSAATVQTGVRIETPSIYDEMAPRAARLATFTAFFKSQGYRTSACLPGNYRSDLGGDVFARDVVLDVSSLGYTGKTYGYVGVPDQFTLRTYRSRVLAAETEPHLAFYLSISTHIPWPAIPFDGGPEWPAIEGADRIVTPTHAAYFHSIEYQWRTLLEFIEGEPSDDAVFILVGDHQPMLDGTTVQERAVAQQKQSAMTPVHVISRNRAFVERFAAYGFTPGIFAEPGTGGLKHEGLQSLFIHEIVGEYGGPDEQRFTQYYPQGLGLGGLVAPQ
jgi:hypothetical protein